MKYTLLVLIIIVNTISVKSQNFVKNNEEVVFSFLTTKNKKLVIAKDKDYKYLVYRYGKNTTVEFQYPKTLTENSWNNFYYSSYFRGGGTANEGLELNYLFFTNGVYKYVIYQEYDSETNDTYCGIKVINTKTNKTNDIKGQSSTIKGSLDLSDYEDINHSDELFEE